MMLSASHLSTAGAAPRPDAISIPSAAAAAATSPMTPLKVTSRTMTRQVCAKNQGGGSAVALRHRFASL